MNWHQHYLPPTQTNWQGRHDLPPKSCFFQVMQLLDLRDSITPPNNLTFALLGFCCDEGVRRNLGREGAVNGPMMMRDALAKMPLHRSDITLLDVGNITCTNGDLESAQTALSDAVALLLQHHITPIILGGGHELAWGHYQGIAKQFVKENVGIINFDAHFDMRPLLPNNQGSSGTPFLQIANAHQAANKPFSYTCIGIQSAGNMSLLFDTAKHHHVNVLRADEIYAGQSCESMVNAALKYNDVIYTSICLDVFATPYAPGVSAPQTLGLTPWQVLPAIKQLAASGKVISYDLAELSPTYDIDNRTAKLAANFIYEIIHHHIQYQE